MSDGFRFAGLAAHIAFVDGTVVEPMRRAGEAGRPLDHLAYGLVGQGFAAAATGAVSVASQAVGELAQAAAELGDRLRRTETVYQDVERVNSGLLAGSP
ncbi:MAG: hypothetical protein H7Y15_07650 [Pseudonocardia sp.]|nr:hypothetical protein [Pseudonocardia sp.]